MIKIDFIIAISLYLFLSILLVITSWMFYNWKEETDMVYDVKYMVQCPYCVYLFFDYYELNLKMCPNCKSYFTV